MAQPQQDMGAGGGPSCSALLATLSATRFEAPPCCSPSFMCAEYTSAKEPSPICSSSLKSLRLKEASLSGLDRDFCDFASRSQAASEGQAKGSRTFSEQERAEEVAGFGPRNGTQP